MQSVFSPLAAIVQTQLDASRRFSEALFSGTEKIDRVFLDAGQRVFLRQIKFFQSMSSAHDPQSAATVMQESLLPHGPDEIVNCQKELMQAFVDIQNDIGRSLQEYIEQLSRNASAGSAATLSATSHSRSAPGIDYTGGQKIAGDGFLNPMTGMFSLWESALREVTLLAQKNMVAARTAMDEAASHAISEAGAAAMSAADTMNEAAGTMAHAAESGGHRRGYANEGDEARRHTAGGRKK